MPMKSVQSAKQRMLLYPKALASCTPEATTYAKCASTKENVRKLECQKEFSALMECMKNSMKQKK